MKLKRWLGLVLGCWIMQVQAFGIVISDQQMQTMMTTVFPMTHQVGQWAVTLSNPVPAFYPKDQRVALEVNLRLREAQREASGLGRVEGQLVFDPQLQQLQLVKPKLVKLDVNEGDVEDARPMIESLQQQIGKSLPIIVLFDVQQLNLGLPMLKPSMVSVVTRGISIEF